jgi:aryl-alcohol dehydrogenase-like predicted oxidoreductase
MQPHYNLLYREEEREMLPLCEAEGIGVIPWSPQARGRLARPWKTGETARTKFDAFGHSLYEASEASDRDVVERVAELAVARGVSMSQVALAWMLTKKPITAPIVGATKMVHLEDAVAAESLKLHDDEIGRLEEPYLPHITTGFAIARSV